MTLIESSENVVFFVTHAFIRAARGHSSAGRHARSFYASHWALQLGREKAHRAGRPTCIFVLMDEGLEAALDAFVMPKGGAPGKLADMNTRRSLLKAL